MLDHRTGRLHPRWRRATRTGAVGALGLVLLGGLAPAAQAEPQAVAPVRHSQKHPSAFGSGGAVSSVDPEATEAGLSVLRAGGNAVDAAVATAAALGVTEPFSSGIGGGGYFVYYDARAGRVRTLDGRETAPESMPSTAFLDPATGKPFPFPDLVTSGLSVGVPGTSATWQTALDRWGTLSLRQALRPAIRVARHGFVVDATFRSQTDQNRTRFDAFTSTRELFLPGGELPAVGSVFRNPDLARTYTQLGRRGTNLLYDGRLGREIVRTVKKPPVRPESTLTVRPGYLKRSDLRAYEVVGRRPTAVRYRGLDVYSMAPSSSGGTTVGEALNILGTEQLETMSRPDALHRYLEASALAFADRNAYVGDPDFVDVPTQALLSRDFARSRACRIDPEKALAKPVPAGVIGADGCASGPSTGRNEQGTSTTHLVTSDRWGNVVSYTLTIEQTGGSGIVVPGRGFLLNNELTDFSATPSATDPNSIEGGKRPRSSMAPTIVVKNGKPFLAVGSPGGATIITTVLQTLINRIDLGMTLPEAVAAPRASQRNNAKTFAEQAFLDAYGPALTAYGHTLVRSGDTLTANDEIGAVAALEFRRNGRVLAVAEPLRRGGGDAGVVKPRRR